MYEFGEELFLESYKVAWLIWMQLLITVLLVLLLLVGCSLVTLDPSYNYPTAACGGCPSSSASRSSSSQSNDNTQVPNSTNTSLRSKQRIEDNEKFKEGLGTSTSRVILRGEESEERDGSSVKDASLLRFFGRREHPCHYVGLAKHAFLKCLGLDSSSESSNNTKHGKAD